MSLTFDPDGHVYRWSGAIVPSVTQIIRTMPHWRDTGGADSEYHMSLGTAVHAICAGTQSLADYPADRHAEIEPYITSFVAGAEAYNISVLRWEVRERHQTYRYAGTIDALGMIGDRASVVIDLKTGSEAWWHPLQTAAYAAMLFPRGATKPRCCIYLDSEGGLPKIKWHDNPSDFSAFAGWLNYARWAGVIQT